MRELQPLEQARLQILTAAGFRFGLLEPTGVALGKSIIDAIAPFRDFLHRTRTHSFELQDQGEENKVLIEAHILFEGEWRPVTASLYRPETKSGDPRIWFSRLGRFVGAGNIIAVIAKEGALFVVNLSRDDISAAMKSGPLAALVDDGLSPVARELLARLKNLSALGHLPAIGRGDTTVGMTIEAALGLAPNSSTAPDYHGIEIKSGRKTGKTRSNLFAQVADWTISGCASSDEILNLFGYMRGGEERLYCTVSSKTFNSQGLRLVLNDKPDTLVETSLVRSNVATWKMSTLRKRLLEKHPETFWVDVDSEFVEGLEVFRLKGVIYTRDPNAEQLGALLSAGVITMDHLIKRLPTGGVKEKGPIFKLKKKNFGLLFPPPKHFVL